MTTVATVTGCPRGCSPAFWSSGRCRRCGWEPGPEPTTKSCPRCGAVLAISATRCLCGWGSAAATLSAIEPAMRVGQPTRERAQELAGERAGFDQDVASLREALVRVEQLLRDVKVRAQRIGQLELEQSGRAVASTRDSLLAALRQSCTEAAHRLEHDAWTA